MSERLSEAIALTDSLADRAIAGRIKALLEAEVEDRKPKACAYCGRHPADMVSQGEVACSQCYGIGLIKEQEAAERKRGRPGYDWPITDPSDLFR